jgi:hypothetical protein
VRCESKCTLDELVQVPADEKEDEGIAPVLGSAVEAKGSGQLRKGR